VGGFRSVGAAVAVAIATTTTACTGHHLDTTPQAAAASSRSPSPTPQPRVIPLKAKKSFSFVARSGQPVAPDTARLVVAKRIIGNQPRSMREVTLLIPRPSLAANCVLSAQLRLHTVALSGSQAEVGVFPSAAVGFARGHVPEVPSQLLDNQPSGHLTVIASRSPVSIEVTELVRAWLRGVFPSQGAAVSHSVPLLFTIQPPDLTEGRYGVTFAGVGRHAGPVLVIQDRC